MLLPAITEATPESRLIPCPHCGSDRINKDGTFAWKDGTRRQRYWCKACETSFNEDTDTPRHYLKKRTQWNLQAQGLGQGLPVRQMAAILGVTVATAFAWRHRLLGALRQGPGPVLGGTVSVGEAFVRYSEKGCRMDRKEAKPIRRFVDRKPVCVLLLTAGELHTTVASGQGRPTAGDLAACLAPLLAPGAELQVFGALPYAEACGRLGVVVGKAHGQGSVSLRAVDRLHAALHGWLGHFSGVATKYLPNYLIWLRFVHNSPWTKATDVGLRMLGLDAAPAPVRQAA
ncbi:MAG TPA: IS1595 family transposase [Symbiobacteriaceae bacterium]|nr:IS1595 family transposase [Symbiobacteriaceae bacterium]